MPRVLIAEDETAIADAVLYALRSEGIDADHYLLARDVADGDLVLGMGAGSITQLLRTHPQRQPLS